MPVSHFDRPTLYWYDLETFGLDPARDRIAQFAGVRTDLALNVLSDPLVLYCKPPLDYLPDPYSCLVTGITPQIAHQRGLVEAEFIGMIRREFLQPQTCVVGYNNIRFDDEVLRYALYRNLYDPYEREWRDGNSRWDILDMVRLVAALRPEGLAWPKTEEGHPSFRLELLTAANGIPHVGAHDALSDVRATIELARRIKECQPRLFEFVFSHRSKRAAGDLLPLGGAEPVIHVSGQYPGERHHLALVHALVRHPANQNGIIVYDLSVDPTPLIDGDVEAIRGRLFVRASERAEAPERISLKTVHLNKCPVLAPLKVIQAADKARLALDLDTVHTHLERLRTCDGLPEKVAAVFEPPDLPEESDPDVLLYRGGFLGDGDRRLLARVHQVPPPTLGTGTWGFHDRRLPEMLFRFRARNFPETLAADEHERWDEWRLSRLCSSHQGVRNFSDFARQIEGLEQNPAFHGPAGSILADLRAYALALSRRNLAVLPYT